MKHWELVDRAHDLRTALNGLSVDERLELLDLVKKMVLMDWEAVEAAKAPVLAIVGGT